MEVLAGSGMAVMLTLSRSMEPLLSTPWKSIRVRLDDAVSVFMVPLKPTDPDDHDHVQHYFEMSMSKCFRASSRQLRCATCHSQRCTR